MGWLIQPRTGYKRRMSYRTLTAIKRYRSSLRRKVAARKPYRPYRYRRKPTRFYNSRKTYLKTRQITNTLRNLTETHIIPLTEFDHEGTIAMTGNDNGYYFGVCTGIGVVPDNLNGFHSIGGFEYPEDVRGNTVYHRKCSSLFQIDMSPAQATTSITEFRVICFTQKMNNYVADMDPQEDLFLANDSNYFGWSTTPPTPPLVGASGVKLMLSKTNKQRYNITKDFRFTLSSPAIVGGTQTAQSYNGKYPSTKRFRFDVPVYKKITLDVNNNPADYNYTHCMIILSRTLGGENLANDWTVSSSNAISTFTDL